MLMHTKSIPFIPPSQPKNNMCSHQKKIPSPSPQNRYCPFPQNKNTLYPFAPPNKTNSQLFSIPALKERMMPRPCPIDGAPWVRQKHTFHPLSQKIYTPLPLLPPPPKKAFTLRPLPNRFKIYKIILSDWFSRLLLIIFITMNIVYIKLKPITPPIKSSVTLYVQNPF